MLLLLLFIVAVIVAVIVDVTVTVVVAVVAPGAVVTFISNSKRNLINVLVR